MAGMMDMLGTMLQQGMSQSGKARVSNALGGSGGLQDMMGELGKMMGGARPGQSSSSAGIGGMLGEVMGQLAGNKAAIGGLGALAGALLGGGGGAARGAVGGGGLAVLASLAMGALQKAGQQPASPPRAMLEPQNERETRALEDDAEVIIKAMINAAKADGQIDQAEIEKIVGKLQEGGLSEDEKRFFMTEAKKPADLKGVAAAARGDVEMAAQIYAASLLAIEVDTEAERSYMQRLAAELGLNQKITGHIEQTLGIRV